MSLWDLKCHQKQCLFCQQETNMHQKKKKKRKERKLNNQNWVIKNKGKYLRNAIRNLISLSCYSTIIKEHATVSHALTRLTFLKLNLPANYWFQAEPRSPRWDVRWDWILVLELLAEKVDVFTLTGWTRDKEKGCSMMMWLTPGNLEQQQSWEQMLCVFAKPFILLPFQIYHYSFYSESSTEGD